MDSFAYQGSIPDEAEYSKHFQNHKLLNPMNRSLEQVEVVMKSKPKAESPNNGQPTQNNTDKPSGFEKQTIQPESLPEPSKKMIKTQNKKEKNSCCVMI